MLHGVTQGRQGTVQAERAAGPLLGSVGEVL